MRSQLTGTALQGTRPIRVADVDVGDPGEAWNEVNRLRGYGDATYHGPPEIYGNAAERQRIINEEAANVTNEMEAEILHQLALKWGVASPFGNGAPMGPPLPAEK
jgi:hypothetical protein